MVREQQGEKLQKHTFSMLEGVFVLRNQLIIPTCILHKLQKIASPLLEHMHTLKIKRGLKRITLTKSKETKI